MPVETEIKLRLDGALDAIGDLLARHGFRPVEPRHLEIDEVYDRKEELRGGDRLLRLRFASGHWTLTYKGPAHRSPYKSREEIETQIENGPAFVEILTALGYQVSFHYEKYRTVFAAEGPGLVTLDETPIGNFLELEGPGDWIDTTASLLGYGPQNYITASYARLYAEHCQRNGGVPSAMKF